MFCDVTSSFVYYHFNSGAKDEDARLKRLAKQKALQFAWKTKRKPMEENGIEKTCSTHTADPQLAYRHDTVICTEGDVDILTDGE